MDEPLFSDGEAESLDVLLEEFDGEMGPFFLGPGMQNVIRKLVAFAKEQGVIGE